MTLIQKVTNKWSAGLEYRQDEEIREELNVADQYCQLKIKLKFWHMWIEWKRNFQKWRRLSSISARKRANAESLLKRRNSELLSQYIQIWRTNANNSAEQKFYLSKMVEKASNFSKSKILENGGSNLFRYIEVKRESERRQKLLWTENQGRLSMNLIFFGLSFE